MTRYLFFSRHDIAAAAMAILGLTATGRLMAQPSNGWKPLGSTFTQSQVEHALIDPAQWNPYPRDAAGFSGIPAATREAIIREAEKYREAAWPALPATTFLEYIRNGNRTDYEHISFTRRHRLAVLVLAEAFENKGRFIDPIVNGIWAITEESFWGVPAHLFLQQAGPGLPDVQDPAVDLFAAVTAQELAWTYYLLKPALDKVNPLIAKRIVYEEKRRILEPYLRHNNWGYQGFEWRQDPAHHRRVNNWNPWINSNVLVAALLTADDPGLRAAVVHKTMESLDNFMIPYPADGGSDEGPEYWGRAAGSVIDYLETLKSATGGKIDALGQPVVRKMGSYIYQTYIGGPYYYNYGDADAIYHPDPLLLFRFGAETGDSTLMHFAAFQAQQQHYGSHALSEPFGMLNRALASLSWLNAFNTTSPKEPLPEDVWLGDLQIMVARSQPGSRQGLYLAVKGGDNGESHNHNDVGSFIVYVDGKPALIDAGAQTYTAQTFSENRYKIWNNQSSYHNLPDINGYGQRDGAQYKAAQLNYNANASAATLSLNIAGAYPREAAVASWRRSVTLLRGKHVSLTEDYQLEKFLAPVSENFLTPLSADISQKGVVTLRREGAGEVLHLRYDARHFSAAVDTILIRDGKPLDTEEPQGSRSGRMYGNWGDHLYRIRLTSGSHALKNKFTITID